jgi:hypothetical protein
MKKVIKSIGSALSSGTSQPSTRGDGSDSSRRRRTSRQAPSGAHPPSRRPPPAPLALPAPSTTATSSSHQPRPPSSTLKRRTNEAVARAVAEAAVKRLLEEKKKAQKRVSDLDSEIKELQRKINQHCHQTNAGNLGMAAGGAAAVIGAGLAAPTVVVAGGAVALAGASYKPKRSGAGDQYQKEVDVLNQTLGCARLARRLACTQLEIAEKKRNGLRVPSGNSLGATVRMEFLPRRRRRDE